MRPCETDTYGWICKECTKQIKADFYFDELYSDICRFPLSTETKYIANLTAIELLLI